MIFHIELNGPKVREERDYLEVEKIDDNLVFVMPDDTQFHVPYKQMYVALIAMWKIGSRDFNLSKDDR